MFISKKDDSEDDNNVDDFDPDKSFEAVTTFDDDTMNPYGNEPDDEDADDEKADNEDADKKGERDEDSKPLKDEERETDNEEDDVDEKDVTLTIIRARRDIGFFDRMECAGKLCKGDIEGVYNIMGGGVAADRLLPTRIILTDELKGERYAPYRALSNKPKEDDIEYLIDAANKDEIQRKYLRVILNLVAAKHPEMIEEIKYLRAEVIRWRQALIKHLSPGWADGLRQDIFDNIFPHFEDYDAYQWFVKNCCNGIDPFDNPEQSAFLKRLKDGTDDTSINYL